MFFFPGCNLSLENANKVYSGEKSFRHQQFPPSRTSSGTWCASSFFSVSTDQGSPRNDMLGQGEQIWRRQQQEQQWPSTSFPSRTLYPSDPWPETVLQSVVTTENEGLSQDRSHIDKVDAQETQAILTLIIKLRKETIGKAATRTKRKHTGTKQRANPTRRNQVTMRPSHAQAMTAMQGQLQLAQIEGYIGLDEKSRNGCGFEAGAAVSAYMTAPFNQLAHAP